MKEDTQHCLDMIVESINEKDKLKLNNYMNAFYIKAIRDIKEK